MDFVHPHLSLHQISAADGPGDRKHDGSKNGELEQTGPLSGNTFLHDATHKFPALGDRQVQTYQPHRDEPEALADFLLPIRLAPQAQQVNLFQLLATNASNLGRRWQRSRCLYYRQG